MPNPSPARMYDWLLGGTHNHARDRHAAEALERARPGAHASAHANRAFLQHTVRHCLDHGVTQFIELGSGLPTMGHVHHTAHTTCPQARVVYVDSDSETVEAGSVLIADSPGTAMLRADLCQPRSVLTDPLLTGLIDLTRPVAVLLISVLHLIPDDALSATVAGYRDRLAPGSVVAISHLSDPDAPRGNTYPPLYDRTQAEVKELFSGLELLPTGVSPIGHWVPDALGQDVPVVAGIGQVALPDRVHGST